MAKTKKKKSKGKNNFILGQIERRRRAIELLKKESGQSGALTTDALDRIVKEIEEKTNEQRTEIDFDVLSDEQKIQFLFEKVNRQEKEILASQMYIGYTVRVFMEMQAEFGSTMVKFTELNEEIDKLKGSSDKWETIRKRSEECLEYLKGIQKAIEVEGEEEGGQ